MDSVKVDFQGGAIKRIEMIKRSRERPLPSLRGRGKEPIAGVNMAAERRGGNERSLALHADYIGLNSLFFRFAVTLILVKWKRNVEKNVLLVIPSNRTIHGDEV